MVKHSVATSNRRGGGAVFPMAVSALMLMLVLALLGAAPTAATAWADEGQDSASLSADAAAAAGQGTPEPLDDPDNQIDTGQLPDNSFLYETSIASLAAADSYYDGQEVQVKGEAVGEAIRVTGDDGHCWVTLCAPEDNASLVVYMRDSDADKIDTFGAYGKTGSTVVVRGTFNLVCSEHDGESDLHAASVSVSDRGSVHPDSFDVNAFIPGFAITLIGLIMLFIFWRLRERAR